MINTSFETTAMAYVSGNEQTRCRDMWIVAHDFKQESKQLNGHVTVVRRRKVKSTRPILG